MRRLCLGLVLGLLLSAVPVGAQEVGLHYFSMESAGASTVEVPINGEGTVHVNFYDKSRDGTGPILPGSPGSRTFYHMVNFEVDPVVDDPGWYVAPVLGFVSYAGVVTDVPVRFQVYPQATLPEYTINVTAVVTTQDGTVYRSSILLTAFTLGPQSFEARVDGGIRKAAPEQVLDFPVVIMNKALEARSFDVTVGANPCDLLIATQSGNFIPAHSTGIIEVSVQAPYGQPYYFSEFCRATVRVAPTDAPELGRDLTVGVTVEGGYIDPVWIFWAVGIILVILLLVIVIKRRKERIEEEILGKPQKPWTIPVEKVYLKHLKASDERAWYVVRHYLMEEEYRSALAWYASYKAATKGDRAKERLIIKLERKYERWKAAWQKRIAAPIKKADKYDARLQRKLDRKARVAHLKAMRKHRKRARKAAKKHAKRAARIQGSWEKQAARASKKGRPLPERPTEVAPEVPPAPERERVLLADHKWQRKADRFRRRMVRKQGNLEVRFEKADVRHLAKVRRKVHRIGRRLNDPEFAREHPLMGDG